MTLWNPLNVFSSSQRRVGNIDPVAAFDPSRTGDPIGPGYDRPAIGFGDTSIGEPAGYGRPRRRPIGFAPPEEEGETRYRTELSFKRHHELPRASATQQTPDDAPRLPWETPGGEVVETGSSDVDSSVHEIEAGGRHEGTDATTAAEEKVPFFKREISFRRKRTPIEESAADGDVEEVVETVEAAGEADAWPSPDEVVDEPVESHEAEVLAAVEDEVPAVDEAPVEEEPAEEAAEVVLEEDTAVVEGDVTEPPAADPAVAEKVPFYKRELSFRRKSVAVAAADEIADAADAAPDTVAVEEEPAPWDVPVASSDVEEPELEAEQVAVIEPEVEPEVEAHSADPAEEPTADDVPTDADPAEEIAAVVDEPPVQGGEAADHDAPDYDTVEHDTADQPAPAAVTTDDSADSDSDAIPAPAAVPAPVGAWDDEPAAADQVDDGLFIEDTPPPAKGRFGRKEKVGGAAPKRKQARGGKGGKGRRVVGLKIGASQMAAAVVVEADGGHELVELARRPLAAGIVVDGEVKDVDALSNAVKAFFDEEKLPRKDVRIGLASNRIGVRTFDIVGIDDETKFDNAVRFKAHEVLPVAAHESVLDYRVLEERPNEAGEPLRRVLLVVAPRDQVEPYVEVANRAGIKLAGVDLEALGLLRAFVEPKPFAVRAVDDTATVVVAIGHESSTLLVSGGGTCEFTRVFDWGGGVLEEAIASALEVHPAEAATILRHLSLSGPGRQFEALDETSRAKALDAVRLRLTPFARELVASLQFYQTQAESLGIGGILITGGTSHLEGLADALHQMIGVNVSVGDPLVRVRQSGDFDPAIEAAIGSMAVPIGLAIDDLGTRGVDLLPKDAATSSRRLPDLKKVAVPVAVAVPLVALGFLYVGAHGKVSDTTSELDAVNAQIAALPEPSGPSIDASVQGDEAARATAVANVLGGRLAWDAVFRDLARVLPSNVSLTSLSATLPDAGASPTGAAPVSAPAPGEAQAPPTAVVIEGYTNTQPDVARLLARLTTLPSLRRVTLTSSRTEPSGNGTVVRFSIVADLSQTGGPS